MFIRKKIVLEWEKEYHINLSTPMNLYNMYIILIQIHMHKLQLKVKKKKKQKQKQNKTKQKCGVQERFNGKTIGEYIYIYIYISSKILIIDF